MRTTKHSIALAETAYRKGHFPDARKAALDALKTTSTNDPESAAARNVLTAIESDPLVMVAFGFTFLLLIFITAKFLL